MKSIISSHFVCALFLGLMVFYCCRTPYPIPDSLKNIGPSGILDKVKTSKVTSIKASGVLDIFLKGKRIKVDQHFCIQAPSQVYFEVEGGFGPLEILASNGTTFAYYSLREKRFYWGLASRKNIEHFLRLALSPAEITGLFLGGLPVFTAARLKGEWNSCQREYSVFIWSQTDLKIVDIQPDPLRIRRFRVFQKGRLYYQVEFSRFVKFKGIELPSRLKYTMPSKKLDIKVLIHQFHGVNQLIPESQFQLTPPPGVERVPVQ